MDSKSLYNYCLTKPGAIEDYPFGPDVIVIKVAGKIFALLSRREGKNILSLKCNPEYAELLRKQYPTVTPGYHLNKQHWNTILLDGRIPENELRQFIDHSYDLVYNSLPKRLRTKSGGDW